MEPNSKPTTFSVQSFGCKVNTYDSGLVQKNMDQAGFVSSKDESSDVYVINSCAVTAEATKEAARKARRLKAKNPLSKVILTGCAAQVDTDYFTSISGIDLIVANSHKAKLPELTESLLRGESLERVYKSNIFDKADLEPGGGTEESHTRAFLKIQDGCNSFCTYCVIPFARGKSRSIAPGVLIDRINELHFSGINEVVLTGVHIGDYHCQENDRNFDLSDLVQEILSFTSVPRIKLSSLEPVELTDKLLQLYADHSRLCSHFHMSIQSVTTNTLKAMKRNYGREEVEWALRKIQEVRPGAFVGMDIIAGFPTETEEDFLETYEALSELPWTWIHAFPYSERGGTYAARLKVSVAMKERKLRARRLRELSGERYLLEAKKQVGLTKEVMGLKAMSKGANCLSDDYWPVLVENLDESYHGKIFSVRLNSLEVTDRHTFFKANFVS